MSDARASFMVRAAIVGLFVAVNVGLQSGCTVRRRSAVIGQEPVRHGEQVTSTDAAAVGDGIPHEPGRYFAANSFREDALAGHHQHALVWLVNIPLFVIRDEDVFKTTADRAAAIARALQEALHSGDRFFVIGTDDGVLAIYSVSHHGGFPRLVLRVTRADAVAYARRSDRTVDERLLAEWWLALLKDLFRVVFFNGASQLTNTATSIATLTTLRHALWNGDRAPVSEERIDAAVASLAPEIRENLYGLAFRVPSDFQPISETSRSTSHPD